MGLVAPFRLYGSPSSLAFFRLSPSELPRSLTAAWESGHRGRQHSNDPPIIHRDLKSPNVLINSTWDAKVRVLDGLRVSLRVSACAHLYVFRLSRVLVGMGWI
jgi:hypothetical protein